jgi:hypothetical protein
MRTVLLRVVEEPHGSYAVRCFVDEGANGAGAELVAGEPIPADLDAAAAPELPLGPASLPGRVALFVADTKQGAEFGAIGDWLAGLVLRGSVDQAFADNVLAARPGEVRVMLEVQPSGLAALPWEFMRRNGVGLFTDPARPMSRTRPLQDDAKPDLVPLRLMAVEGPSAEAIGSGDEIGGIIAARPAFYGRLDLRVLPEPTQSEFELAYETVRPHVLHFAGHAIEDPEARQAALVVGDWRMTRDYIRNVMNHVPRLVVLNACRSDGGVTLVESLTDAFMARGAAAVIGMRGDIRGKAAGCFGSAFYGALADELVDTAASTARRAVYGRFGVVAQQRDWGLPSLTLRVAPEQVLPLRCGQLSANDLALIKSHFAEPTKLSVDRVDERWKVYSAIDPDEGDRRRLALVVGSKGIGKSWLVHLLRTRCALRGRRVRYVSFAGRTRLSFMQALEVIIETDDDLPSLASGRDAYHRFFHDARHLMASRIPPEPSGPLPTDMPAIPQPLELGVDGEKKIFASFRGALERDAAERSLLLVLDQLEGVYETDFLQRLYPYLVKEIGDGNVANVQAVVVLRQDDRATYLPATALPIWEEIRVDLIEPDQFPDLARELLLLLGHPVDDGTRATLEGIRREFVTGPWSPRKLQSLLDWISP